MDVVTKTKAKPKNLPAPAQDVPAPDVVITSIKGFNADWTCRGYKFELGGSYTHPGSVAACTSGFHGVEGHPLEVFNYYPPASSRYAEVQQGGELSRHSGDSKLASAKITIGVELSVGDLVHRAAKWVFDRADWKNGPVATGKNEGATASGYQGAATASGYQGAATASGTQGAATASGIKSIAAATGWMGKARAPAGGAIFLAHRDSDDNIVAVAATLIGQNGTKPDVWYRLDANGHFVEAGDA